jgi:hypothetical protein
MQSERGLAVCVFYIPIVRDSDRKPHPPILWMSLQDALVRRFGALTGPRGALVLRMAETVSGAWSPSPTESAIEDENREYKVSIPDARLDELRSLLKRAGNSFDQKAIYLEIRGSAEVLMISPEDGYLLDD